MIKKHNIKIQGIGAYVPRSVYSNSELYSTSDREQGKHNWPESHLGIKERRWVGSHDVSNLGYISAKKALQDANLIISDIDLIIVSTSSSDKQAPSTACRISNQLGATCPCFDINSVCSGFVYGLNMATAYLESNMYKNILLIATETYSKITDLDSRDRVYFGDGAGAVILNKDSDSWMTSEVYADSTGIDGFVTPTGGTFIMDGKAVYQAGTTKLPLAINKIISEHGIDKEDITHVVPHQPGIKDATRDSY